MLRFILGLVTIGIVVFCLVYFLWPLDAEKPSVSAAATVRQNSSAASQAKAKSKGGEDEEDDENDNDENNTEQSEEDALQEQMRELRLNR